MSPWFLDASVMLAGEDPNDAHHADARRLLLGTDELCTLDLAFYEVSNVAVRSWGNPVAAARLREGLGAIEAQGGLVRADPALLAEASDIAGDHAISVYDAAYVAAARRKGAALLSCDVRDLVSKGLARLPGHSFPAAAPPD